MFEHPIIALGAPGPMEIGLIVLVILLLFGAKRLPELARGLGKGIREFRSAVSETSDAIKKDIEDPKPQNDSGQKSTPDSNSSPTSSNS